MRAGTVEGDIDLTTTVFPPHHLMAMMKKPLSVLAFLAAASSGNAEDFVSEPEITEQARATMAQTLKEALHNSAITQPIFAESMSWLKSYPCKGIDRTLTESKKAKLAKAIARQEQLPTVDVLQAFAFRSWNIVYVSTGVSDEPYLFYSGNPISAKGPVTAWSGAATILETSEIKRWVLANAPGVPIHLADCFSWHVTLNRD
jgi:hypothetical protein